MYFTVTPESKGTTDDIRQWIVAGERRELALAIQAAEGYSIGTITALLDELSVEFDEACDKFLRGWLETLSPLERLAAAVRTEHFYELDLCATPQAADRALLQVMESVKPAIELVAEIFEFAHGRASDPDPSYTKRFTPRLLAYAEQLRSVAEDISNDVPLVQFMSDEVARIEAANPEGYGQPAKYQVADALAQNHMFPAKESDD